MITRQRQHFLIPWHEIITAAMSVPGSTESAASRARREANPGLAAADAEYYEDPNPKLPVPPHVMAKIRQYAASGSRQDVVGTTFTYIVDYLESGGKEHHSRLFVAAADFGIPISTLAAKAAAGIRAKELAAELTHCDDT